MIHGLFGGSLFFTGVRKDNYQSLTDSKIIELDPFIDLNLNVDYQYNTNWTFYLSGLNLIAGSYEKWYNYPCPRVTDSSWSKVSI